MVKRDLPGHGVGDPTVDEATDADVGAVRELLARANEQYRSTLDPAAFEPYLALVLDIEARAADASLLVARVDGSLAGTVTFFPDAGDEGWGAETGTSGMRSMAVDPAWRGRGVGGALVTACVQRAQAVGASALTLHTAPWLPHAIALYERAGFVRDPSADQRASDIIDVPTDVDFSALGFRLDLGRAG